MSDRRARERLTSVLNGDRETMDPVSRRGLYAVAAEIDGVHDDIRSQFDAASTRHAALVAEIRSLKRLMIGLCTAIVTAASLSPFIPN